MSHTEHHHILTVAILTYNRREFLQEVLESLTLQTYKDFDVIIFDNGSDYDVREHITMFPSLDITIDANEVNLGNIANFRKMIAYPFTSPYVIMFHDDDTIHPEYFKQAVTFLEKHTEVVWVGSNIRFITEATPEKMKYFRPISTNASFVTMHQDELICKLMNGFSLGFNSVVYRTSILKRAKERYEEFNKWLDRPFIIDLIGDGLVGITEEKFINYRVHAGQDSQYIEPEKLTNAISLFKYYKEKSRDSTTRAHAVLQSNNAINTAFHVAGTYKAFLATIEVFKQEGLFTFSTIGWRGMWYFLKFTLRWIRLRLK